MNVRLMYKNLKERKGSQSYVVLPPATGDVSQCHCCTYPRPQDLAIGSNSGLCFQGTEIACTDKFFVCSETLIHHRRHHSIADYGT
jgi:hypothetical protein